MGKDTEPPLDVFVLGDHPAAYLAAALLRHNASKLRVLHAIIPDEPDADRLVFINPELFTLSKLLEPLRRKLDLTGIYGLQFLADDGSTRSEHRGKAILSFVASYADFRAATFKIAHGEGVEFVEPKVLQVQRLDEAGLEVLVNKTVLRPRMMIVSGKLPDAQQKLLGLGEGWDRETMHRYTFVRLKGTGKMAELGGKPVVPMSLDLKGMLCWAWALPHNDQLQLAVEQPHEMLERVSPLDLLKQWVDVLRRHNILKPGTDVPFDDVTSIDMPLAGALASEGVANRTLLIGPAGGFYSATAEDLYPACWSAVHAADVARKALKEPHLQDALQPYRHKWRTTLGDYLRGPQQNLRFLLPLVYRNPVMTNRLVESILLGKSVVR